MSKPVRLSADEIERKLRSVRGWQLTDQKLRKVFKFADFASSFTFMTSVAFLAERHQHHPEWSNVYDTVVICLSTHEAGGISDRDFELARAIDSLSAAQPK